MIAVVNDQPCSKSGDDRLQFSTYARALAETIKSPSTATPLSIGIFGPWGSGKTSLMRMIQQELLVDAYPSVWFSAWRFETDREVWRIVILRVLECLQTQTKVGVEAEALEEMKISLYRASEKTSSKFQIEWSKLVKGTVLTFFQMLLSFLLPLGIGKAICDAIDAVRSQNIEEAADAITTSFYRQETKRRIEQVALLEHFHESFARIIKKHICSPRRMVVFIDDLDRCQPSDAVATLEAIKLFLDVPETIFVFGLDYKAISRALESRYFEPSEKIDLNKKANFTIGQAYLEKIIQIPFHLPRITSREIHNFISGVIPNEYWPDPRCAHVFAAGLGNNPRQVKRTINVFFLLWQLSLRRASEQAAPIRPVQLAKLVALSHVAPGLYLTLREAPRLVSSLEEYLRQRHDLVPQGLSDDVHLPEVKRIFEVAADPEHLFAMFTAEELEAYFTLTRRADVVSIENTALPVIVPELIQIPSGSFNFGSSKDDSHRTDAEHQSVSINLDSFWIGRYPVTNREYYIFVSRSGHRPPPNWQGGVYEEGRGDHPIDHVSWEDASAYCRWLSESSRGEFTLPTEAQWEKAARGRDGFIFPWGNEWDPSRLNSLEAKIGMTTPVGAFSPRGDSPFGLADMAGNVWEWCSDWVAGIDSRRQLSSSFDSSDKALKGGAYRNPQLNARCSFRLRNSKYSLSAGFGFRVVCKQFID